MVTKMEWGGGLATTGRVGHMAHARIAGSACLGSLICSVSSAGLSYASRAPHLKHPKFSQESFEIAMLGLGICCLEKKSDDVDFFCLGHTCLAKPDGSLS